MKILVLQILEAFDPKKQKMPETCNLLTLEMFCLFEANVLSLSKCHLTLNIHDVDMMTQIQKRFKYCPLRFDKKKSCLNCNCSRGEFFCSARFFLVKPQEALIKSSNLTIFSLSIMYFRHDDPDSTRNNTENECYCLQDEGFKCLPSGAMYMEPCKRADQAPVARFHVHGTCRHTFETFILQAITFNFAIVPC